MGEVSLIAVVGKQFAFPLNWIRLHICCHRAQLASSIFTVEPIRTYNVSRSSCSFVTFEMLSFLMEQKLYKVGSWFH